MKRIFFALFVLSWLSGTAFANDTSVTFGVMNNAGFSMSASFEWEVTKNGTVVVNQNNWYNATVYNGTPFGFYANLDLSTNDVAQCTYTYAVYTANGTNVTPPYQYVTGTLNASWQSGQSTLTVEDPMQPPGGSQCFSNVNFTFRNNDISAHTYMIAISGSAVDGPVPAAEVPAGAVATLSDTVPCAAASRAVLMQLPDSELYYAMDGAKAGANGVTYGDIEPLSSQLLQNGGNGLTGTALPVSPSFSDASSDNGSSDPGGMPPNPVTTGLKALCP